MSERSGPRHRLDRGDADRVLRRRLHAVHGLVGLADEIVLRDRVRGVRGDAEARRDGNLDIGVEAERRADDGLAHAVGHGHGLLLVGLRQDDAELVAAEADDFVDAAHGCEDPLGDLLQRARAGEVAVEVVHGLQLVEVEEDDAEERAVAARALDLLVKVRLEEAAIEGLGEVVAHGQVLAARQLIDVAEDGGDGADVARDVRLRVGIDDVAARDRDLDDADEVVLDLQRHDDHPRLIVRCEEAPRGERALEEGLRDAGKELAGVANALVVGEADDVALEAWVVDEEGAVREAEEVEDRSRDALGDLGSVGHGHELGDLREIAALDFEAAGVDGGLGEVDGEAEVIRGVGEEDVARQHELALLARTRAEDDADERFARRRVGVIVVEQRHAAGLALRLLGDEREAGTALVQRVVQVRPPAVDADRQLSQDLDSTMHVLACASPRSHFATPRSTSGSAGGSTAWRSPGSTRSSRTSAARTSFTSMARVSAVPACGRRRFESRRCKTKGAGRRGQGAGGCRRENTVCALPPAPCALSSTSPRPSKSNILHTTQAQAAASASSSDSPHGRFSIRSASACIPRATTSNGTSSTAFRRPTIWCKLLSGLILPSTTATSTASWPRHWRWGGSSSRRGRPSTCSASRKGAAGFSSRPATQTRRFMRY